MYDFISILKIDFSDTTRAGWITRWLTPENDYFTNKYLCFWGHMKALYAIFHMRYGSLVCWKKWLSDSPEYRGHLVNPRATQAKTRSKIEVQGSPLIKRHFCRLKIVRIRGISMIVRLWAERGGGSCSAEGIWVVYEGSPASTWSLVCKGWNLESSWIWDNIKGWWLVQEIRIRDNEQQRCGIVHFSK